MLENVLPRWYTQMAGKWMLVGGEVSVSCHVVLSTGLLKCLHDVATSFYRVSGLKETKVEIAVSLMT